MTRTCDTSVLVPALVAVHPDHDEARAALAEVTDLPAHVVIETYSVLTRLPPPLKVAATDAARAIAALGHAILELPGDEHRLLITRLGTRRISGGATYDALVAATAGYHDLELLTRDRRAVATYEAVGVRYALL